MGADKGGREKGDRDEGGDEMGGQSGVCGGLAQRRAGTDGEEVSPRTKRLSEESRLVIV